jgi:hypothetical protein
MIAPIRSASLQPSTMLRSSTTEGALASFSQIVTSSADIGGAM